jgi:hypothetical protein
MIYPKRRHGDEVKCGGPGMCEDCRDKKSSFHDILIFGGVNMKYPKLKLYAGTIGEGQVVFHAIHPDNTMLEVESSHLSDIQKFCNLHGLELRDEVLAKIKSRLQFNMDNGSYSVPMEHVRENDPIFSAREYVKKIEAEIS